MTIGGRSLRQKCSNINDICRIFLLCVQSNVQGPTGAASDYRRRARATGDCAATASIRAARAREVHQFLASLHPSRLRCEISQKPAANAISAIVLFRCAFPYRSGELPDVSDGSKPVSLRLRRTIPLRPRKETVCIDDRRNPVRWHTERMRESEPIRISFQ